MKWDQTSEIVQFLQRVNNLRPPVVSRNCVKAAFRNPPTHHPPPTYLPTHGQSFELFRTNFWVALNWRIKNSQNSIGVPLNLKRARAHPAPLILHEIVNGLSWMRRGGSKGLWGCAQRGGGCATPDNTPLTFTCWVTLDRFLSEGHSLIKM